MQRATRNKTLTVSEQEIPLLESHISSAEELAHGFRDDMIVNGDLQDCLDSLPDEHFDLIIVDPPYNLDKNFHGRRFAAMKSDDYEEYLRSWFHRLCDKLRPDGSLYMCGDWRCSSSMQRVIEERLTVMNRITWQREKGRGSRTNWKNSCEDIWFATVGDSYTFNSDDVKLRRRVLAPYKDAGVPKELS